MQPFLSETIQQSLHRPLLRVVESPGAEIVREYTGAQLLEAAKTARRLPIAETSRIVLLLLPHSPELFLLQIGLVLSGKIPAVLPWPTTRVDGEKYQRNLLHQLSNLPADHLVTLPRLAQNLRRFTALPIAEHAVANQSHFETMFYEELELDIPEISNEFTAVDLPADSLFLQFSGGTTGTQKCVVVTRTMLEAQLRRLAASLAVNDRDCVVSWLPLYHDMGLIACLYFPLWAGIPSVHFAASDWLMRPELLFHFFQEYQGSLCWLPNFAFSYLAQRREMMEAVYSLGHVRAWINCSEPVRHRSVNEFADKYGEWGVSRGSLQSSYAMAENVFAVTQSKSGLLPTVPRSKVQTPSLYYQPDAFELIDDVYVSSGRCLPGMQVRIVNSDGSRCPDFAAGEIQLHTVCLFNGYWDHTGFRRDAFVEDGWYRTGDYGFLANEELYVIGRIKDIIIVAGQNIFPEDVENITAQVAGVHPGRVVAFAVENGELGTQSIAVVAEMTGDFDAGRSRAVEQEIRKLITAALGIAPRYVRVVPQRWIVKSTAGKLSRRDTRKRFLEDG
jgi:acyl-CoA synthetase (AMP-forming)/AMP-acid ligase II